MNSFLYKVSEVYYREFGADINKFTFVFPNRRAGLFFRKFLSEQIVKPVFSPEITTINDCFVSASKLQQTDRISSLFRLYDIYKRLSKSTESFDTFAFWGEMLLADFNEVDRYLVDTKQLFTNVSELKETGDMFDYLSENQINAIRKFWKDFQVQIQNENNSEGDVKNNVKEFIEIWKVLFDIYTQFTSELFNENCGTDGMIFREVAELCRQNEDIEVWENKKFVFVGFNALNPCEKELMKYLKKREKADFYWDYDADFLRDDENPSSYYCHENQTIFSSKFEIKPEIIPLSEKRFEVVAVPSTTGQAKEIARLLKVLNDAGNADWLNTAVVLPDENLLMPVLNSIPDFIPEVNVTMGYPISLSPVSGLVEALFELQKRRRFKNEIPLFYFRTVTSVLQHHYVKALCDKEVTNIIKHINKKALIYVEPVLFQNNDLLKTVFQTVEKVVDFPRYLLDVLQKLHSAWLGVESETEFQLPVSSFIYPYYTSINRLNDIIYQYKHVDGVEFDTIMRIIRQLISGVSVPFTGEPLEGLQVMGVLETRGLDFENLIFTSFNEGVFPSKSVTQSFIPYSLRKSFGLPVYEQQDAITSYNFYRLLQRSKRIYMIYDSRSEGLNSGEVSRFLYQLQYHYNLKIYKRNVLFDLRFEQSGGIKIEKTNEVLSKLSKYMLKTDDASMLSASSINNYISCPLRFYFSSIEKLKETPEISEIPGNDVFGSVFHKAIELVYEPCKSKMVTDETLKAMIKDQQNIKNAIYKAIAREFLKKDENEKYTPEGNLLLVSEVLFKYVTNVLNTDIEYAPFRYITSEEPFRLSLPINDGEVNITGIIDRVDEKEGKFRILDYKTGSENLKFKNLDDVFSHDKSDRNSYVLQTMLYGMYYINKKENAIIEPGLYFIRKTVQENFSTQLIYKPDNKTIKPISDFSMWTDEFKEHLINCLEELFNPDVPFFQTEDVGNCENCSFTGICQRL